MKYTAALLALAAASATALPTLVDERDADFCLFGTYKCSKNGRSIRFCNIIGTWELAAYCDPPEVCITGSTGIVQCGKAPPPPSKAKRAAGYGNWCPTPGEYTCAGPTDIQVCNTTNQLQITGVCVNGTHCGYINNIPYCVN